MIVVACICIVIICLAEGYPGGWLGGFAEMGTITALAAIPGLPWLLGVAMDEWLGTGFLADVLGWLGTGALMLLAAAAVAQGIARLGEWWRGEDDSADEGAGAEADHF
jgi:hypothetical protein